MIIRYASGTPGGPIINIISTVAMSVSLRNLVGCSSAKLAMVIILTLERKRKREDAS